MKTYLVDYSFHGRHWTVAIEAAGEEEAMLRLLYLQKGGRIVGEEVATITVDWWLALRAVFVTAGVAYLIYTIMRVGLS